MLKVKNGEKWLRPIRERVPEAICFPAPMSSFDTRSLINACDRFVSLHCGEEVVGPVRRCPSDDLP
jgi:hypothetical protein